MGNIDHTNMIIPTESINAINETALDQLTDSRDMNREVQVDSETSRAIIMAAHAHQVIFVSDIDITAGVRNIHVLKNLYTTYHVLHVSAHNIDLQIANLLHHMNNSRRI